MKIAIFQTDHKWTISFQFVVILSEVNKTVAQLFHVGIEDFDLFLFRQLWIFYLFLLAKPIMTMF